MMNKLCEMMRWLLAAFPLSRKPKGDDHATATDDIVHGRRNYRVGVHPFAAGRDQALVDIGRVRVLEKAISDECLRAIQHGERASVRHLTSALADSAKRAGLYIPYSDRMKFGDMKRRRSGESEIFAGADFSRIIKFKDPEAKQPIKQTAPSDWLLEHVIHNVLFPDTRYEFAGVSECAGCPRIVLEQRTVKAVAFATEKAIAEELNGMGLLAEDRYCFGNEVLSITDVGARGDNVLLGEDRRLYFIDPLIRLKRPAVEALDWLIGDVKTP